jgi:hypothetical protein
LPKPHPGPVGRFFSTDDLIALDILGELLRISVPLMSPAT